MLKKFTKFFSFLFSISLLTLNVASEELKMQEILEIIQKDLRTLERAVYSDSFEKKSDGESTLTNKETEDVLTRHLLKLSEIENQLNELENEERKNYMKMINVDDTGLNLLIKKGYDLLSLETFFTSGVEETRAWTINKNCMAPQAAGIIHTDFEKGFIRAETVSYQDFVGSGGWLKSRENGKMRLEGKDYIVKDGDVLNFRFNT